MALTRIDVHRNMLIWAIERVGSNVHDVAANNANVQKWIDGESKPTLRQLTDFAKHYYVPLGYMFLPEPPYETEPITMFRANNNPKGKLNVSDLVNITAARQDWLSEYLRGNGFEKLTFVASCQEIEGVEVICQKIRRLLQLPTNWAFEFHKVEDALNHLVEIIEDLGVTVNLNSLVGLNSHRKISVDDCRGFALVDDYAPFIFVNSKDAKSAQVFTLIHEFSHLLLGYTAGVGGEEMPIVSSVESLCDSIAATLLVPQRLLQEEFAKNGANYEVLVKRFKVSRYVIARRLVEIGLIDKEEMFRLYSAWKQEPVIVKQFSGGNIYRSVVKRCGRTFLIHLNNAVSSLKLQPLDAYRLAGMKGDTFRHVMNQLF